MYFGLSSPFSKHINQSEEMALMLPVQNAWYKALAIFTILKDLVVQWVMHKYLHEPVKVIVIRFRFYAEAAVYYTAWHPDLVFFLDRIKLSQLICYVFKFWRIIAFHFALSSFSEALKARWLMFCDMVWCKQKFAAKILSTLLTGPRIFFGTLDSLALIAHILN